MIRGFIADDAPLVRRGIRYLLDQEKDIEIVGEAGDGPEAVEAIRSLQPDLLFLDIQMPGFGGFEVIERTGDSSRAAIIFVTAYDQYALKAFEARASDYLLKPIKPERFREAVERSRRILAGERHLSGISDASPEALPDPESGGLKSGHLTRFMVRENDRFLLVKSDEVDWIEAEGEYVRLCVRSKSYLIHRAISDLEQRLDPQRFTRIHRSIIVNLDRIRSIGTRSHGDCDVLLQDGTTLRMSRGYRANLFE